MQATLRMRAKQGLASPRLVARLVDACGWSDRLAAACAAGHISPALADSVAFVRAMSSEFCAAMTHSAARRVNIAATVGVAPPMSSDHTRDA